MSATAARATALATAAPAKIAATAAPAAAARRGCLAAARVVFACLALLLDSPSPASAGEIPSATINPEAGEIPSTTIGPEAGEVFSASLSAAEESGLSESPESAVGGALAAERNLSNILQADVEFLCDSVCDGRRSCTTGAVEATAWIARRFDAAGLKCLGDWRVHCYDGGRNVIGVLPGRSGRYVVVAASYDGLGRIDGRLFPGADSNASGVAALCELARLLGHSPASSNSLPASGWLTPYLSCPADGISPANTPSPADGISPANTPSPATGLIFVALDGHNSDYAGARALLKELRQRGLSKKISAFVNLDILGATLSPVDKGVDNYLIALGGSHYRSTLEDAAEKWRIDLSYDYYGSANFTDVFYRRIGDQTIFQSAGISCVVFTSGITMLTNRPDDTPSTLDYPIFSRRVLTISSWLQSLSRR